MMKKRTGGMAETVNLKWKGKKVPDFFFAADGKGAKDMGGKAKMMGGGVKKMGGGYV